MNTWYRTALLAGGVTLVAGCATRGPPPDELPPTAAGPEYITDDADAAFYLEGPWRRLTSSGGFYGDAYQVITRGTGENYAVWNIETIQEYQVFARWVAHSNRASNAKYTIHYLDEDGALATKTITANQKQNGGEWAPLGTYRMSNLTGRVTLTDDADGYVVADAVRFVPVSEQVSDGDVDGDGMPDDYEIRYGLDANDRSDAALDADNDGLTNVEEYLSKTDPAVAGAPSYEQPEQEGLAVTLSWSPPRDPGEW